MILKIQNLPPLGQQIWIALRIATFTTAGLYVSLMFSAIAWLGDLTMFICLPLAFGGVLMMLFGLGLWGRWRNLFALALIPLWLVGFPWFQSAIRGRYIDWHHHLFLGVGSLIVGFGVALLVRWWCHKRDPAKGSGSGTFLNSPTRASKLAIILLGLGGAAYGSDYLLRSLHGRFEPQSIGLSGVKSYAWAPRGFVHEYRWSRSHQQFYYGLWVADTRYWHSWRGGDDPHANGDPINKVSNEDLWKVYRAWK